jgi:hypothetical protein
MILEELQRLDLSSEKQFARRELQNQSDESNGALSAVVNLTVYKVLHDKVFLVLIFWTQAPW